MQIKTIMRHHLTSVRLVIIQKTKSSGEDVENKEPLAAAGGMQIGTVTREQSMEIPKKKNKKIEPPHSPAIPLLGFI